MLDRVLRNEEEALDVDRRESPPILDRVIREGLREIDARIVDERIDRSEFALGRLGDPRRCRSFADVSINQRELVRSIERELCDVPRTRDHVITESEEALHETRSDAL